MFFASLSQRVGRVFQSLRGRRRPTHSSHPLRRWRDYGLLRLEDRINPTPVLTTTSGSTAYAVGQPATAVDPGLTVTDPDSPTLTGATVLISAVGGAGVGEDFLEFTSQGGITGTYEPGPRVLAL